jgi:hypothetical protein
MLKGGINVLERRITGKDEWTVYERQLGTSPEQVRDQEERVHQRAGDLAQHSCDAYASTEKGITGDTVSQHSHNSEDSNQDAIHREAARLALRSKYGY